MSFQPIIEVLVNETGDVHYRLRPCTLSTLVYGEIFATLARQVAGMMAQEGGFNQEDVYLQIVHATRTGLEREPARVSESLLQ
jgi:hypothetical protein